MDIIVVPAVVDAKLTGCRFDTVKSSASSTTSTTSEEYIPCVEDHRCLGSGRRPETQHAPHLVLPIACRFGPVTPLKLQYPPCSRMLERVPFSDTVHPTPTLMHHLDAALPSTTTASLQAPTGNVLCAPTTRSHLKCGTYASLTHQLLHPSLLIAMEVHYPPRSRAHIKYSGVYDAHGLG